MKDQRTNHVAEILKLNRHMKLTILPLQNDVDFAADQLALNGNSQFWRRTAIRCGLALLEATLWNMKHISPIVASLSGVRLTPDDLQTINEEKAGIKNGQPFARRQFPRFRANVKATFSIFAKVHRVALLADFNSGFDSLCDTYELRSRLMHPKRPFDPNVSDPDIDAAQRGANWLNQEFGRLMKQCEQEVPTILQPR